MELRSIRTVVTCGIVALTAVSAIWTNGVLPRADAADGPTPSQAVSWAKCPKNSTTTKLPIKCASIVVPRDYKKPAGAKIHVLISKVAASGKSRGTVIGNPGGPGGDAVDFVSRFYGESIPNFHRDFDIIGMQPRGLRWSTPLDCSVAGQKKITLEGQETAILPTPLTCGDDALSSVTTENTARDVNEVRKALGLKKISFLGVSYGTELGAAWASLFPKTVDKLILDSNVNPDWIWNQEFYYQAKARQPRSDELMTWLSEHNDKFHLGTTPFAVWKNFSKAVDQDTTALFLPTTPPTMTDADLPPMPGVSPAVRDAIIKQLNSGDKEFVTRLANITSIVAQRAISGALTDAATPGFAAALLLADPFLIPSLLIPGLVATKVEIANVLGELIASEIAGLLVPDPTGAYTSDVTSVATIALYTRSIWPRFGTALSTWVNTNNRGPMSYLKDKLIGGEDATSSWVQLAVVCQEGHDVFSPAKFAKTLIGELTGANYYDFTADDGGSGILCASLPGRKHDPVALSGKGLSTTPLLIQSIHDPATPYPGGPRMAQMMGGKLITVDGGDHGNVGRGQKQLDKAAYDYLLTGRLPSFSTVGTAPIKGFDN